ncbi:Glutaredoxin-like protein NrdH [compost metagenome]
MAHDILVYSMEGCPPCAMVKQFLTRMGVEFQVKDVKKDPQAQAEFLRLGFRGTPVTVIDGRPIVGFDQAKLMAALRQRPAAQPAKRPVKIEW